MQKYKTPVVVVCVSSKHFMKASKIFIEDQWITYEQQSHGKYSNNFFDPDE